MPAQTDRNQLLAPQDAPDLQPLRHSHEASQLETELKGLFMAMFDQFVRPSLTEVNTLGAPHLGGVDQLERAVKVDGIALQRSADIGAMRYIHRAFRARNPKRGLHMLRTYLQLLFGDGNWEAHQLWQEVGASYPMALHETEAADRFLTGRVHVKVISSGIARTPELMAQALRSVLPARMLLRVSLIAYPIEQYVGIHMGALASVVLQRFTGEFVDPPFRVASNMGTSVHHAATASMVRQTFSGTFQ